MTAAERLRKSSDDRIARGESRLSTWLSAEATTALNELTGGDTSRGAVQSAVNEALVGYKRRSVRKKPA